MSTIKENAATDIHAVIKERHSVRAYDPNFKISNEEIMEMLAEATLAPSSSNLQPWRFIVVTDPKIKEAIKPFGFNQKPVADASAVIILLGDLDAYKNVEKVYDMAIEKGLATPEIKERLVNGVMGHYPNMSEQVRKEVALLDGGLVTMQFMLIAKSRGLDTVAMGGFDAGIVTELFKLPNNLKPLMIMPVGKALEPAFPTVRLPIEEITFFNGLE